MENHFQDGNSRLGFSTLVRRVRREMRENPASEPRTPDAEELTQSAGRTEPEKSPDPRPLTPKN